MKRFTDGRTYNTENSTLISSRDCPGESVSQLRYWEEDLHRTDDGCWFIRGAGGPLTLWRGFGGEGILPIGSHEASLWLQEAGEVEAWRKYFGRDRYLAPVTAESDAPPKEPEPAPDKPVKRKSTRAVIEVARKTKAKKRKKAKKTKAVKTLRKASNRALLLARRRKD